MRHSTIHSQKHSDMPRTFVFTFAVVALTLFGLSPALGQEAAPPPDQPQEVPDITVDDEELTSIARAYINVQNITTTYRERLNGAQDAEAAKDIQQEYAEVANSAIQDEGLSLERYDTVINVAAADADLRERLVFEIESLLEEAPSGPDS